MTPVTVTAQERRTATLSPIIARESWRTSPLEVIGMKTPSLTPPLPRAEEDPSSLPLVTREEESQRTTPSKVMTQGTAATIPSQTGINKSPEATTALSPIIDRELHTALSALCEEITKPLLLQNHTAHYESNATVNDVRSAEKPKRARVELGDSPSSDKTEEDIIQRDECNPKRAKNSQGISPIGGEIEENKTQRDKSLVGLVVNSSAFSMVEEKRKLDGKENGAKLEATETKLNALSIADKKRKSNDAEDVTDADLMVEKKRISDEEEDAVRTLIDFEKTAIVFDNQSKIEKYDQFISKGTSKGVLFEAQMQGYSMRLGDYDHQEYQKLDKVQKELVLALVEFKAKSDIEERLAKQDEIYISSCPNMEVRLAEQKETAVRAPSLSRPDMPGDEVQRLRQQIHHFQNQTRKSHIHYSNKRKSRYSSCYWCCRCRRCKKDATDDEDNSDSE
jgi:hypothetical protein